MSEPMSVESLLGQAKAQESEYNWLGATESYKKALGLAPEHDFLRMGDIHERSGYAFYRLAMQAVNQEEFKERMHQGVANYEKAKGSYEGLNQPLRKPRELRCDAMIAYMGYWLTSEVPEKKRLINECWRLTIESLKAFEEAGDALEYGRTYNQLSTSVDLGYFFHEDFQVRVKIMKDAVEHGEKAVKFLSALGDPCELARAYVKTAICLELCGFYFQDLDENERYYQKAMGYWMKANELSEERAMLELPSVLFGTGPGGLWGDGTDNALSNFGKALEYAWKTKDKFIIGRALDLLAYHTYWRALAAEDPDERVELQKKALQCAEDARRQYSPISFISPRGGVLWAGAPYAQHYWHLAFRETDLSKRKELSEKAIEVAPSMLKLAKDSGYIDIIGHACLVFSIILRDLARIETNSEEKKRLLEKALVYGNESTRISDQVEPFAYWNRGAIHGGLARIRYELADLAKDPETKKKMLQEVLLESENSLELGIRGLASYERGSSSPLFAEIGLWHLLNGFILNRLYGLTKNVEHLKRATEVFKEAAEWFQKVDQTSRVAECHWKAAQVHDDLGEHLEAAEDFNLASDNYKKAADKIPQLRGFYQDHALYMEAWSEIEKARHHHARQEYGSAREHFEKAANLHKSLKQWSYLASNYSAWVQVEHAEELSRKEQSEEAIKAFEQAIKLFMETETSLQAQLSKIESVDEKHMATNMVKATDLRHEYCVARIAIEEAKILDKKGDHGFSSEKYGSAAKTLEKIVEALESEQERKELKLIISLSHAWQKMTRAEAEASPSLYAEASRLFEEAKELSPNEKTRMLTLGHSRFCKALEAGTKFVDTRERAMHVTATKCLESAASYYVKAGFQNASEYAKATELLFDAYVHMDNAKEETDPEKKAKLYAIAEKVLQTSAGSFMKAEHPEKREQVLGLLEKVKEERELAISITEVLHAPSIISTTTSFTTPTPTREEAVGSERFEHADVQANIVTRRKELKVGDNLDMEIELINAGKGPALLIKVAEVIPEDFELIEKPENCRVEDSHLNLKGKRLDPLKTEEVRIVLKPRAQGVFQLKPKILYIDENGKYKSHEPEPINVTVKELGIKGWLKGER